MNDIVIRAKDLRKVYQLYARPEYRLLDMLGLLRNRQERVSLHPAVDGIDLEVRRGEKVGIIGRNGAGKSPALPGSLRHSVSGHDPQEGDDDDRGNSFGRSWFGSGWTLVAQTQARCGAVPAAGGGPGDA